jgi:pectate lyase
MNPLHVPKAQALHPFCPTWLLLVGLGVQLGACGTPASDPTRFDADATAGSGGAAGWTTAGADGTVGPAPAAGAAGASGSGVTSGDGGDHADTTPDAAGETAPGVGGTNQPADAGPPKSATDAATSTQGITCVPQVWEGLATGWASVSGGTTGGGAARAVTVSSLAEFNTVTAGAQPATIHVSGQIAGVIKVGSNKTILGLCGAELLGSLHLTGSSNVIVRNLKVTGLNCTDSPGDCSAGEDAIHVDGKSHHLWFDHLDVSDGSDGNLDVSHGADFITISWTKFHYSSRRTDPLAGASGHRFCNLIGHDDANTAEDVGHLNVTFHHVWWADNVDQRMPRVRFGKVHLFDNLYTATGSSACIEIGVNANIRAENNDFRGVRNAIDNSHANAASIMQAINNQGANTNLGGPAFTPPYPYAPDPVAMVNELVSAEAGPK